VRADRHSRPIELADLPPGEPAGLAQHHGHDEERRLEAMAAQDRERMRVLAGGRVIEGQQHRLGGQWCAIRHVVDELVAGDRGVAGLVERTHLRREHRRSHDVRACGRVVAAGRLADLVVAEHRNPGARRDRRHVGAWRRRRRRRRARRCGLGW
jgi:hypothetical protein